ncbi:MAG TPA: DNA mismatch repair protein MutS [Armatimonadota bacterium]|nr:DNA mismatch repair protein MutS [Armatimonadota bacterium]
MDNLTPMLSQYRAIKREHEDVILLFRLGDFYEMFGEDAKLAAEVLDLVLTSREVGRGRRVPMCGIPYHAADRYLARLLAAGHKAAVCEQVEDPRKSKGLVKREVIRILTPGTVVEEHLLEEGTNNFLASAAVVDGRFGLAAADCSTGELMATEFTGDDAWGELADELARLQPAELLIPEGDQREADFRGLLGESATISTVGQETFLAETPEEVLRKQFGVSSLRGFGGEGMPAAIEAAAAIIVYLGKAHKSGLEQIRDMRTYSRDEFMVVDATTRRNLELLASLRDGSRRHTLLWVLDDTLTPMGARLLRRWITEPLLDRGQIEGRLDAVTALHEEASLRARVRDELRAVRDLERPLARAAAGTASGRDLAGMRDSLGRLPGFAESLGNSSKPALASLVAGFDPLTDLRELLGRAVEDSPPATLREGGVVRTGYSAELDELREARTKGKEWIAGLQERARSETGIKSLKVGFNQVFGYYIEVTRPNLHLVPEEYQRRQTMRNAERFITPELKEYESKVLGAEERILALEQELFAELRAKVAAEAARIQRASDVVARADVLASFAEVAARNHYVRPEITTDDRIEIRAGRHPVVELTLQEERFVPNDAHLDCAEEQLLIITGPNMAGKSTYLRQVALIALMAQVGSFVPAEAATIGTVDRIFSRVGASDDLATGQSTFMVEMTETANILRHATKRSLIILDELGRGTSTFDGLSIAWSVAEYIHDAPRLGAKTMFATHYHHLNELADSLPRVRNYRVGVKEKGDQIVFLRQIVPGGTDRSYGIQVARLAGLPTEVIERAKQVLWSLEERNNVGEKGPGVAPKADIARRPPANQLALFAGAPDPVVEEIRRMEVDRLTPLEALNKLAELQRRVREQSPDPAPPAHEEEE